MTCTTISIYQFSNSNWNTGVLTGRSVLKKQVEVHVGGVRFFSQVATGKSQDTLIVVRFVRSGVDICRFVD